MVVVAQLAKRAGPRESAAAAPSPSASRRDDRQLHDRVSRLPPSLATRVVVDAGPPRAIKRSISTTYPFFQAALTRGPQNELLAELHYWGRR